MFTRRFAVFACAVPFGVVAASCVAAPLVKAQSGIVDIRPLTDFDAPFLFAYGTWEKRAKVEGGRAIIGGDGVNGKGGAGANVERDLSGAAEYCPVLRVRVGAGNKLKAMRLLLIDDTGRTGIWEFALPQSGEADVYPKDGAALAKPNMTGTEAGKTGVPNLSRIRQWQIQGDWSDDAPDVQVDALLLSMPNDKVKADRAALAKRDEEAREAAKREAEDAKKRYGTRTALSPIVDRVSFAAPNVLAVEIRSGRITPSRLEAYKPRAGDTRKTEGESVKLVRGNEEVGWLIGAQKDGLVTFETFAGDPLLDEPTNNPASYTIQEQGSAKAAKIVPTAVWRKSRPLDWAQPGRGFVMLHTVYLPLPKPLTPGKAYTLSLDDVNTQQAKASFTFAPDKSRSEAVHVNQIGFRPGDVPKFATFSLWAGTGGAYSLPNPLPGFRVVNDATGQTVYTGKLQTVKEAGATEKMQRTEDITKTAVYRMDFSLVKTPGRYRVVVDGAGCSYPFEIAPNVWTRAFKTQMRGLFHNRSGMTLGPPYTTYNKPRDFYPANGAPVFQSTLSVLDGKGEFDVAKYATKTPVPNAWGGYHDAGDWNPRRATHLRVTLAQLELAQMFPAYVKTLSWNIPKPTAAPDIVNEALWEIDCFRRLQTKEGGIPYGIETGGDPIEGEVSWKQSMPAYVFAPDRWSSYLYATAAARAAKLLASYDAKQAQVYRDSAVRAMNFAEKERAKAEADGTLAKTRWEVKDDRNLAAVALLELTGEKRWHDVFLQDSVLKAGETPNLFAWGVQVQRDSAFAYARLPKSLAEPGLQEAAKRGLVVEAEKALAYASGNPWSLTSSDSGKPMFLGFFSTSHGAVELVRAHFLTGEQKYRNGAVAACQFQLGANPGNQTYTTGLGANPPRNPLKLDARRTGQPAPEGLTVYGNYDFVGWRDQEWALWPMKFFLNAACRPSASEWPVPEAYFDIFLFVAENEYTVDIWAPNVYVWGYLGAKE